MKTFVSLLIFVFLFCIYSCKEQHTPVSSGELIGRYEVRMDSSSLEGKSAKDAAIFAMLNFEYVFHKNQAYEYNHHLGGMMKQVTGQWYLSNDSLYTTDEQSPEQLRIHFVIQAREEHGFKVKKNDQSFIHLIRK